MKNNQKGLANLVLIGTIVVIVAIIGYVIFLNSLPCGDSRNPWAYLESCATPENATGIVIQSPKPNEVVQFPLIITGYINGNGWTAFEGVAGSVQLFDANNKAI